MDRKKDFVISGGENVYPGEVEEVILRHPLVRDVVVIGVPNDRLGETVCTAIDPVEEQRLTEEEITACCEATCRATSGPAASFSTMCREMPRARWRSPS